MPDRIHAVLLDAVGTLIEPRQSAAEIYAATASQFGIHVDRETLPQRLATELGAYRPPACDPAALHDIPRRERETWRALVRNVLGPEAASGPCFDALFDRYGRARTWRTVPGAQPMLARLRGYGTRLAVVSNMDGRLPQILAGLDLLDRVDQVIHPSCCGLAKPDARIFHFALQKLGVRIEQALYVGDREERCVAAARRAGLRALRYAPAEPYPAPGMLRDWRELDAQLCTRAAYPDLE